MIKGPLFGGPFCIRIAGWILAKHMLLSEGADKGRFVIHGDLQCFRMSPLCLSMV